MRSITVKVLSVLCAAVIAAAFLCACDADPTVVATQETTEDYQVINPGDAPEATERDGFHEYGTGKTDPIDVNGTQVNVCDFALRSYELAYMMALEFARPTDLPVDAVVQYALIHVYFTDFYSINNKTMLYRSASEEAVRDELKKQFGTDDFDIKDSVLYNPEKKVFEMWTPAYGTNIYYNIDAVNIKGDEAEIITTFFNELKHSTMLGRATITVKVQDGKPVIASLKRD